MQERPLGSRYVLTEVLGRGAMGRVFRARVTDSGEVVAVKLLRDDLVADGDLVGRFLQEGRLLKSIRHDNVVRVRDLVAEGDDLGIVMDLVPDGDLRHCAAFPSAPALALQFAAGVAEGLAAVHSAGITHRDLKPENVLVVREPDGSLRPQITDFGISRFADATVSRATGLIGTPGYLAPEVARGARATPAADVYALGVMLYELWTGHGPFAAESALALIRAHAEDAVPRPDGMDDDVWRLLSALLAKEPSARPAAAEAATFLRRPSSTPEPERDGSVSEQTLMRDRPSPGADLGATTVIRPRPPADRSADRPAPVGARRVVVGAAVAVVVVLLATVGVAAALRGRADRVESASQISTSPASSATSATSQAATSSMTDPATTGPATSDPGTAAPVTTSTTAPPAPDGGQAGGALAAAPGPGANQIAPVTTSTTTSQPPPPAAPAAAPAPAPPAAPVKVSAVSVASASLGNSARLYFGQLSGVLSAAGVTFRTTSAYRAAHPSQCVSTVVVRGVSGSQGAVFAAGLGGGWGAAESAPDQNVAADGGTLHQQLVVPPSGTGTGTAWTGGASMTVDGWSTSLGSYRLAVTGESDGDLLWSVAGSTVRCSLS